MAARLMMYYSEHSITCDDVTYEQAKSQLGEENFIILPVKKLKGMQNIKAVYEYRLKETLENLKDIDQFEEPCLGMLKEKAIVTEYLKKIKEETEQKIVYYHVLHHFVIVKGDSGIGKGRFLYWSCLEASNLHYKVITCKVNIAVKDSSLSIVSRILTKLLKLKGIATKVKQKLITTILRDSEEIQNIPLCLLNELFQIQFPYPKEPLPQDQTTMKNMLFDLLLAMFQKLMETQPLFIAIDDAHNMDDDSWKLLYNAARAYHHVICIVATSVTGFNRSVVKKIMKGQVTTIILQPLESNFTGIIACHFLNVIGIHKKINDFLIKHAKGNPQWIKELLLCLEAQKLIKCTSYPLTAKLYDRYQSDFIFPCKKYFSDKFYNKAWIPMEKEAPPESVGNMKNITSTPLICDTAPATDLEKVDLPKTMEDLIQQGLNIIKTRQQVLLKTAATLQTEFDVELLAKINPDLPIEEINQDINDMINHHFIEYVQKSDEENRNKLIIPSFIYSTVYESMTNQQKITLHIRIATCLEKKSIICPSCSETKQMLKNDRKNIDITKDIVEEEMLFPNVKVNLRACKCLETRFILFDQLSSHWNKALAIGKAVEYYYLTANAAIKLNNFEKAASCLQTANDLINSMHKIHKYLISKSDDDIALTIPLVYVKSKRISTHLNFHEKNYEKALSDIRNASHLLKHSFPAYYRNSSIQNLIKIVKTSNKNEVSEECKLLSIAIQIYIKTTDFNIAYDLAKFLKNILSILKKKFYKIIDSHILFIESHFYRDRLAIQKQIQYEENAMNYCMEILCKENSLVFDDLKSIGKLYKTILYLHLFNGNLDRAIDIDSLIDIQPYVAQALLYNENFSKCIEVLSILECNAELANNNTGMALYYGNLAELINYNLTFVSGELKKKCSEFAVSLPLQNIDREVEFYLTANMALWCIKNLFTEEITKWYSKAESLLQIPLEGYWAIAATGCMLEISIENFYQDTIECVKELKEKKEQLTKEIEMFGQKLAICHPLFIKKLNSLEERFSNYWDYKKTFF
ncbi:adenylate cyclase type 10-like isoform X2 [Centruroides vittatus]|uniref:adenylate cyclase type 10-like isoform X2 n=1 Tax=Centruroides vittatus TaxID=120091 RepID=UPI0035104855